MSETWFRPKTYGYGATPANWQGWVATFAFAGAIVAMTVLMLFWKANALTGPGAWQIAAWLLVVVVLTAVFIWLARAKTDGQWAWRWGK
jgi:small-conductance mechanosensitive channel